MGCGFRAAALDLVAPESEETDGAAHGDAVDAPAELRLVEDGFEQAARGAGRDDLVADALDLHLGPSEAGEVAPSANEYPVFELRGLGHKIPLRYANTCL
jgi:hypothetical protein